MVTRKQTTRARREQLRPTLRKSAATGPVEGASRAEPRPGRQTPLAGVGGQLPEIGADLKNLAAVQLDRVRTSWAHFIARLVAGLMLLVVGAAVSATAAVMLVIGLAGGVVAMSGGPVWLANAITGSAVLLLPFAWLAVRNHRAVARRMADLRRRYEPGDAANRASSLARGTGRSGDHVQ